MGERRAHRGPSPRTDQQVLANQEDIYLLDQIAHGRVKVDRTNRMILRSLSREQLCLAGFGLGTVPTLLPRGRRILAAAHGETSLPAEN